MIEFVNINFNTNEYVPFYSKVHIHLNEIRYPLHIMNFMNFMQIVRNVCSPHPIRMHMFL